MKALKKSLLIFLAIGLLLTFAALAGCTPAAPTDDGAAAQSGGSAEADAAGDGAEAAQPLTASQIADGSYEINTTSSSSMFRIVKCVLNVAGDTMTATMTLSSDGYDKLYAGTGEEALADSAGNCIPAVLDSEGAYTFTLPLQALNTDTDCAAWSVRKQKWYDRVLVFLSDAIPEDALQGK
ncbi:MAG: hypothetical protein K6B40_07780 [Firmicutes bacterium]|nr:hypothetical protein [Bacillota bacterium]